MRRGGGRRGRGSFRLYDGRRRGRGGGEEERRRGRIGGTTAGRASPERLAGYDDSGCGKGRPCEEV